MNRNGFFAILARMKHIARWGLMRNSLQENLSQHSFDVAVTAHALALIGQQYFGKAIDAGQVAAAALFHDAPEILTGDMPTPVKYHNPGIREAYRAVEASAVNSLLAMLPQDLRPKYKVLFSFDTEQPEMYAYIKAADKISAWVKCVEELKSGNSEFKKAELQLRAAIAAMDMPEAEHYMRTFAPAFSLTLDELQSDG